MNKMNILWQLAYAYVLLTLGFMFSYFDIPPAGVYKKALSSVVAHYVTYVQPQLYTPAEIDLSKLDNSKNVVKYDAQKSWGKYTLLTIPEQTRAILIDMQGAIVHEWGIPYTRVNITQKREHPCLKTHIYWSRATLFANGDLMAMYDCAFSVQSGYGLIRMNKDSEIIWASPVFAHHDMDLLPDGRILTLTNHVSEKPIPGIEHLAAPLIVDSISLLSPKGRMLRSVDILPAFVGTPYEYMLKDAPKEPRADYMHPNSVQMVTPELHWKFPSFPIGSVLVSIRNINALAVIDMDKKKVVWAKQGTWERQHEANMQDDGSILLFDNWGFRRGKKGPIRSRVIKIDPYSGKVLWAFEGNDKNNFFSEIRGMQQVLPNGNMIVVESMGGRVFEVTPQKEIVWEYRYPYNEKVSHFNVLVTAERFSQQSLPFLSKQGKKP